MLGASAAELEWSPAPFQRLNEILGGLGGRLTIFGSTAGVVSWHATTLLTKSVAAAPATRVARETRAERHSEGWPCLARRVSRRRPASAREPTATAFRRRTPRRSPRGSLRRARAMSRPGKTLQDDVGSDQDRAGVPCHDGYSSTGRSKPCSANRSASPSTVTLSSAAMRRTETRP